MPITLFGPGEQKTGYSKVQDAISAGYEVSTRQRDYVFMIGKINSENGSFETVDNESVHLLILNPQQHVLDEPSATTPLETRGGVYVETKGLTKRSLSISGTMGVMPLQFLPTDNSLFGSLIQPAVRGFNDLLDSLSQFLGAEPYQGLEEMERFRQNILWKYYGMKKKWAEGIGPQVYLVLYVIQDQKRYIIEPKNFRIQRNVQSRMTYPYQMEFTVVSEEQSEYAVPDPRDFWDVFQDGVDAYNEVNRFFSGESGLNETGRNLQSFANLVNATQMHTFFGVTGRGFQEDKTRMPQNWQRFWGDFDEPGGGDGSSRDSRKALKWSGKGGIANQFLDNYFDFLDTVEANKADYGLYDYDGYILRDNLDTKDGADAPFDPLGGFATEGFTPLNQMRMLREAAAAMCSIKSAGITAAMKAQAASTEGDDLLEFDDLRDKTIPTGSPLSAPGYTGRRPTRDTDGPGDYYGYGYLSQAGIGLVPMRVHRGDHLDDVAFRYLGDRSQYRMLAAINNLEYPYLAEETDREGGLIGYGDYILVPMPVPDTTSEGDGTLDALSVSLQKESRIFPRSSKIREVDRFFGVDLYYDIDNQDLAINRQGDLEVAVRDVQVRQFLQILTNTTKGSWKLDRGYGIGRPPGFTSTRINLVLIMINAKAALLADPRIRDVSAIRVTNQGNMVVIYAEIVLAKINVATSFFASLSVGV